MNVSTKDLTSRINKIKCDLFLITKRYTHLHDKQKDYQIIINVTNESHLM